MRWGVGGGVSWLVQDIQAHAHVDVCGKQKLIEADVQGESGRQQNCCRLFCEEYGKEG